jgi:hypothetical protein
MKRKPLAFLLALLLLCAPQPIAAIPTGGNPLPAPQRQPEYAIQLSITDAIPAPQQALPPLTKFEPSLLKRLLTDSDGEPVHAIVMMREQSDMRDMQLAGLDRATRAEAIIQQLQSTAERSQTSVRSLLHAAQAEQRVRTYKPLWIVNGIAVEGMGEILWELAAHPDVSIILDDHVHYLPDAARDEPVVSARQHQLDEIQWNVQRVQADLVWETLDITGEGVVVANLDSGVDWEHPSRRVTGGTPASRSSSTTATGTARRTKGTPTPAMVTDTGRTPWEP